jgi:sugar-specific transcriptional regulator TrmB
MIDITLQKVFEELGLSSFDLDLYQLIINSPKISVTSLSKSLSTSRSRVYQSLHTLQTSEIISFQPFAKNKIIPLNPNNILTKLKYKSNQIQNLTSKFESILPELKGEFGFENNNNFSIVSGASNLFLLLHQMTDKIPEGGKYLWFNETNEVSYFFRDFFFGEYSKQRSAKNIFVDILANPINTVLKNNITSNDLQLREIKYLPANFKESSTFTIFEQSVIFWNIPLLKAYLINDKMINLTLRSVFDSQWVSNYNTFELT